MKLRLFQKETVLGEAKEGGYGRLHLGQKPRAGKLAVREHPLEARAFAWHWTPVGLTF